MIEKKDAFHGIVNTRIPVKEGEASGLLNDLVKAATNGPGFEPDQVIFFGTKPMKVRELVKLYKEGKLK